ncbi:hypothetical protein KA005_44895, partial [bacterium]|nr:hypothetical protein [bacterium]
QVRKIVQAEASLREKLTQGEENYEELERVAVLRGVPPFGKGSRNVPRGRWSYHGDGYFIRYFPSGYQTTQIELYVPEHLQIERDSKDRITLIADSVGNRIETDYDDTIEPLNISGDPTLKGYAFRSIIFECNDPDNPEKKLRIEWKNTGWTFHGVPTGKGSIGTSPGRFSSLKERYEWAKEHKKQLDELDKQCNPTGSIDDIMNLGHYTIALKYATSGYSKEKCDVNRHINIVRKGWQYAVSKREGGYMWGCASPSGLLNTMMAFTGSILPLFTIGNPGEKPEYDPADNVATPGNTSRQRLAKSGRPTSCWEDAEKRLNDAIDKCFEDHSLVGKGKCNTQDLIRCWWQRVVWYGGTKREVCISRDCSSEGVLGGPYPDSELSNCINNAVNDFKFEIESCLLSP